MSSIRSGDPILKVIKANKVYEGVHAIQDVGFDLY